MGKLEKLLSKRRTKLRELDVSGAAAGPVMKARKAVQELQYLTWLFPFVKVRHTKSNLSLANEEEGTFDEDAIEMELNHDDENDNNRKGIFEQ